MAMTCRRVYISASNGAPHRPAVSPGSHRSSDAESIKRPRQSGWSPMGVSDRWFPPSGIRQRHRTWYTVHPSTPVRESSVITEL